MMRIAILATRDRIAPQVDCADYAIVATVGRGHVLDAAVAELRQSRESEFEALCRRNHVQTVICVEILPSERQLLADLGVNVICGVEGSVCSVLFAFAEGKLKSGQSQASAGPE